MIELSEHAGVFGMGFAMNLAYALISDRIERIFLSVARETDWITMFRNDPTRNKTVEIDRKCLDLLLEAAVGNNEIARIRGIYLALMPYLVGVSAFSLLVSGFFPSFELAWWWLAVIDGVILLPVPITLYWANRGSRTHLAALRAGTSELIRLVDTK